MVEKQNVELKLIHMEDVVSKEVEWLWYPYIPYGKITIIEGDPGEGKTTLVLKLAAALSRGLPLPCDDDKEYEPIDAMDKVAYEAYRVLKKGKMCAVMIGDIRKCGKVVPLGFRMMECFLRAGFINKEIIIKEQHNCKSTGYWEKQNNNFLLLAHEYIFVFEK